VRARSAPRAALVRLGWGARRVGRELGTELDVRFRRAGRADLAIFHELVPPPTGGGHQFVRALVGEIERRGLSVELNRISSGTPACLFNSFNFDFRRLRRFARADCRFVHRVDGPIQRYRGYDDGTDSRIAEINRELASATVVQSRYSLEAHRELGIELVAPSVIHNAVDPAIFHPPAERARRAGRRVRLIASSWSDNPNKGGETVAWLDRNLDPTRFELTLLGRFPGSFRHARALGALASEAVADELRRSDVYIAPSRDDPCSNALLEALACGLPVAYLESGGHPELVGEAGLPFTAPEELPDVLERLVSELDERRAAIRVPSLADVVDRYLMLLLDGRPVPETVRGSSE
jgi:glycosyltransferase involved in cell wall biosynthesis